MKIIKNYLYNVSYQLLAMILPIVTLPYVSRILGATGLGTYSFSYSIVQYFTLISLLGVTMYGNREIARTFDTKKRTSTFIEIYTFQFLTSFASLIVYLLFCYFFIKENQLIFYIQSIYIISCMFDISWFFMGLELFKKTVSRNMFTKILGTILIFTFVKKPSDLTLYVCILAISTLLGQLIMWSQLGSEIDKKQFFPTLKLTLKDKRFMNHLSGLMALFIPQIAIQVFTSMDKIILGLASSKAEVGFYDNANKIARMLMAIVTSLGTVMLPRMSKEISLGNAEKVDGYLKKSMAFMVLLSVPLMFGIAGISQTFVPVFFGPEFMKVTILLPIVSIIIFTIATNNVMGTQYLIPMGENKKYSISVILAAVVDIVFNLLFIVLLNWKSVGAAISLVLAETTLLLSFAYFTREKLHLFLTKEVIKSFAAGIFMCIIVFAISILYQPSIVVLLAEIVLGGIIYLSLMLLFRSKVINDSLMLIRNRKNK